MWTRSAFSTPPETFPRAPAISFTHTFANDGELTWRCENLVAGVTSITVCDAFRRITVKVPDVPATPHAPALLDPLTETTIPKALRSVGTGDQIITSAAAIEPPDAVPDAPTISLTHTFANVGNAMSRPKKAVEDVTSTTVDDVLRPSNVKVPGAPADPQAPLVLDPLTEVTIPNAETVRGGLGAQIRTRVALKTPPDTAPVAPAVSFTHTLANVGDVRSRPENVVEELTAIVVCEVFRATTVKLPDAPATPHVPSAVDPFTIVTSPKARTGREPAPAAAPPTTKSPSANVSTAPTRDIFETDPVFNAAPLCAGLRSCSRGSSRPEAAGGNNPEHPRREARWLGGRRPAAGYLEVVVGADVLVVELPGAEVDEVEWREVGGREVEDEVDGGTDVVGSVVIVGRRVGGVVRGTLVGVVSTATVARDGTGSGRTSR